MFAFNNKLFSKLTVLSLSICSFGIVHAGITLSPIGGYETDTEDAAEIVAHDAANQQLFVVNGDTDSIDVLDISDPTAPSFIQTIELSDYGSAANSVDVFGDTLAVAVESDPAQDPGSVVFFNTSDYSFVNQLQASALPDMLTFTPDGKYLLVANEGEPDDDYLIDPEGSITIIRIGNKNVADLTQSDVKTARFNNSTRMYNKKSIRVFGPGATLAQDLEPEYIAVYRAKRFRYNYHGYFFRPRWKAMVTLQENNAVAIVDVARARVEAVVGLGFKNHDVAVNAIDASNEDDGISINTWPVYGMYQPDAIASYTVNGRPYFIIANEGDARDYDGFSEEDRVKDLILDSERFPNATELQEDENLGRLKITNTLGDFDNDGDYDYLFSYGARSFSILNRFGGQVYDSNSQFEFITASSESRGF